MLPGVQAVGFTRDNTVDQTNAAGSDRDCKRDEEKRAQDTAKRALHPIWVYYSLLDLCNFTSSQQVFTWETKTSPSISNPQSSKFAVVFSVLLPCFLWYQEMVSRFSGWTGCAAVRNGIKGLVDAGSGSNWTRHPLIPVPVTPYIRSSSSSTLSGLQLANSSQAPLELSM